MPLNKRNLRKILGTINPSIRGELAASQVKDDLNKNLADLTAIFVEKIDRLREEFFTMLNARLTELPDHVQSVSNLRVELSTKLAELEKKDIRAIQDQIQDIVSNKIDLATLKDDLEEKINTVKTEFLKRISSIGGGNANREIRLNSSVMSTRYTDINFIPGSTLGIVVSDNDTSKRADLTVSFDGPNVNTNNKLGIGTSSPSRILEVRGNQAGGIAVFNRTPPSASNIVYGTEIIKTTHDGDMGNGFGVAYQYAVQDNSGVENLLGDISAIRDGADNTGQLILSTQIAGNRNNRVKIRSDSVEILSPVNGYGLFLSKGAAGGNTVDGALNGTTTGIPLWLNSISTGDVYIATAGGNMGVGTSNPSSLLSVAEKLNISSSGSLTKYAGVVTTGTGVPVIYGTGRTTAQTGAVTSVATYTVGSSDGSFYVSASVNVTVYTAGTVSVLCDYTDETNTARTLNLNLSNTTGTIGTSIGASGVFVGLPSHIRAKSGTQIKIYTTVSSANLTYNVEGSIIQIG